MTLEDQAALELRALHRVIASGARALDLEVVLDRCLEQALRVARADAGTLYVRDPKRDCYRLAVSRNSLPGLEPPPLTVDEPPADGHPRSSRTWWCSASTRGASAFCGWCSASRRPWPSRR